MPGADEVAFAEALRTLRVEYERVLAENKVLRPIALLEPEAANPVGGCYDCWLVSILELDAHGGTFQHLSHAAQGYQRHFFEIYLPHVNVVLSEIIRELLQPICFVCFWMKMPSV